MILNRNLNLSSVKVKQKYYLSVLSKKKKKKKKKPTDRPNPKTIGRVTANKLFIKDGLGYTFHGHVFLMSSKCYQFNKDILIHVSSLNAVSSTNFAFSSQFLSLLMSTSSIFKVYRTLY